MSVFFLVWGIYPNTDFLGTQSEFPRLQVTTVTNDEVQEDDAGLFAFDPIRRIDEWREAMLADPNHTRKFSKEDAIPIAKKFLSARGSIVSLKEIMSRFCGDQDVCENKCQY
jgi:hypothetical protein